MKEQEEFHDEAETQMSEIGGEHNSSIGPVTDSTLPSSTAQRHLRTQQLRQDFPVGADCLVTVRANEKLSRLPGLIRFAGFTDDNQERVGVQLDSPLDIPETADTRVHRTFDCPHRCGLLVDPVDVKVVTEEEIEEVETALLNNASSATGLRGGDASGTADGEAPVQVAHSAPIVESTTRVGSSTNTGATAQLTSRAW